jgi:hypothetical protein
LRFSQQTTGNIIQQNSVNPTRIKPDKCRIVEYHYQTETILTQFLASHFLLVLLYLGRTTNRSIPFGYLLNLLGHGHEGLLVCFVFIALVDGVGRKGSEDTTTVDVETFFETSGLSLSLILCGITQNF